MHVLTGMTYPTKSYDRRTWVWLITITLCSLLVLAIMTIWAAG